MTTIIVLILSFVTLLTFSGISQNRGHVLNFQGGRVLSANHAYEPPARKSIIVDIDGMEHPTADNTPPTRRDRSLKLPKPVIAANIKISGRQVVDEQIAVTREASSHEFGQDLIVGHQYQVEEAPLTLAVMPGSVLPNPILENNSALIKTTDPSSTANISLGRRVKTFILRQYTLSNTAKITLRVTSAKGKVTLRGVVRSAQEKDWIGVMAAQIAGLKNVDNQLIVVNSKT